MQWLLGALALYLAAGLISLARTPDPALLDPDDTCSPACRAEVVQLKTAAAQFPRLFHTLGTALAVALWLPDAVAGLSLCRCQQTVARRARRRARSQTKGSA
ncbi:hypothetical protein J0910_30565 [Nocardiopsis sp. CNT-189]|uniref:hypothetical protein n=1 Tax=Nocardiopsis oceanisediminis TaxID=2816862 RepID=UPI003B38F713